MQELNNTPELEPSTKTAIDYSTCCAKPDQLLKKFLEEHFDFIELKKIGFFDKSIQKNDYEKQSEKICKYFGLESIYQYGWNEINAHISYAGERPKDAQFVETFKPWHSS